MAAKKMTATSKVQATDLNAAIKPNSDGKVYADANAPFDSISIKLASPETIRSWSYAYTEYMKKKDKDHKEEDREENRWNRGELTRAETINYRSLKPEAGGLFCERIFGPVKDWECSCGKYKGVNRQNRGLVCEKCHVQVTKSSVRRERMGYINLVSPVAHIWYSRGTSNRIATALHMKAKEVESIINFAAYVVLDPKETIFKKGQCIDEEMYRTAVAVAMETAKAEKGDWRDYAPEVGTGAQAIKDLLQNLSAPYIDEQGNTVVDEDGVIVTNIDHEIDVLTEELDGMKQNSTKRAEPQKRLTMLRSLRDSGNKAEWMVLDVVPVLPPDLRPMVQLDGGRFATSDLNDLYRHIIGRNNRLRDYIDQSDTPDIVLRNEKRILQQAVDALLDAEAAGSERKKTANGKRALKSLSDMLKGKQGRFRQNLLGKRVDYSGRSVIVVGPELKIYQCGLPKEMAIELFRPFVVRELLKRGYAQSEKAAHKIVERHSDNVVWDILEDVIHEYPVMLNRAPTLHRLSIQAFEPVLIEGKAIKLHPLVCTAFNADFDGDQMAVHVPLSEEAQAECRFLLLSPNNLLKPSDGGPVVVPTQDMVLGIYYLTEEREGKKGEGNAYTGMQEAIMAYENGYLDLHARIKVRVPDTTGNTEDMGTVSTTLGRLLFNEIIPQDLGYVDRTITENRFLPEIDFLVDKKQLKKIIEKLIDIHGMPKTAEILDDIKAIGYHYSTKSAITVSTSDMIMPAQKKRMVAEAQKEVNQVNANYELGELTEQERYREVVSCWEKLDAKFKDEVVPALGKENNIYIMATSGARGSRDQIKQLTGWRGLQQDTKGKTIELPITTNFLEGLNVLEYFMSAHGTRKGMSDTALRTADSGYLTRRLVDVAQDVTITEEDCAHGGPIPSLTVHSFKVGGDGEDLRTRIVGRVIAEDLTDKNTKKKVISANEMITPKNADAVLKALESHGRESVQIRTNLTCRAKHGVCAKCYGANMATKELIQVGEAVGIIAAQSIGEPGTQLTMRTFHTGGVAGASGDITQGLPRVEELFEAQKPKGEAIISDVEGIVHIDIDPKNKKKRIVTVVPEADYELYVKSLNKTKKTTKKTATKEKHKEYHFYEIPAKAIFTKIDGKDLATGMKIHKGDKITEGSLDPRRILEVKGENALRDYMLREVQLPYAAQGVDINDKHIEIILRQMMKKVVIKNAGDSDHYPGDKMNSFEFDEMNKKLVAEGKTPATKSPTILGITKASLETDSFLSAVAFQQTTQGLAENAIKGSVDHLTGIKENVLIGSLIPAGTGMRTYRELPIDSDEKFEADKAAILNAKYSIQAKKKQDEDDRERAKEEQKARRNAIKEQEE